jgi:uncharacterized protein
VKRALNVGTWADGKPFTLPLDYVTRTGAFIAIRGGGKTVAATVIAEELCEAGLPWIALDPTPGGVWWGLRANPDGSPGGYPIVIIGGAHADLPFERDLAVQLADAFARENICVVLDVHQESKTTWRAFLTDFCNRLLQVPAVTPRHVFIEEAPEFVPQQGMPEQKRSKAAVDGLVRLGRNVGYGCTLLSQRFATVDKDVLTQCENILALRSMGKPDRRAVRDWIAECVTPEPDDPTVEEFIGSLPGLGDGEGWFWSPQWLHQFGRVKIRERKTLHPGRTRSVGDAPVQVRLSDVRDFVDRFRAVLEAKPPKAPPAAGAKKLRVPKLGKDGIGAVEYGPDERVSVRASTVLDSEAARNAALERARAAEGEAGRLRGQLADLHRQLGAAKATIGGLRLALEPQYRAFQKLFAELDGAQAAAGGIDPAPFEAWKPKLRGGARRVLDVLLERGGRASRKQIATLARLAYGKGEFRACLGQLRSLGLADYDGDDVVLRVP